MSVGIITSVVLGDGEDNLAQQGAVVFGWPLLVGPWSFWLLFAIPGWVAQEIRYLIRRAGNRD